MSATDFIKPNGFKFLLTIIFILPLAAVMGYNYSMNSLHLSWFFLLLSCIVAYFVGCVFDNLIKNKTAKVIFASSAAVISIAVSYVIVRTLMSNTFICDPVHEPNPCQDNCWALYRDGVSDTFRDKFTECMQNCSR